MISTLSKLTEATLLKLFKILCGSPHQDITSSKKSIEQGALNILALGQESSYEQNHSITPRKDQHIGAHSKGSKGSKGSKLTRAHTERKVVRRKKIEPRLIGSSNSNHNKSTSAQKKGLSSYNEICGYINKCKVKDLMALENFDIETVIQIFDERKIKKFSSISDLTNRVGIIKKSHIYSIAKHIGL